MVPVWLTGTVALALFVALALYLAPLHPGVLALQFAATPSDFGAIVHAWPAEDLARFRAHLPIDMLLLVAYGSFGHLLATRTALFGRLPAPLGRAARWLLPLAALFDAAENALHAWLTEVPRFGVPVAYRLAASCAIAKWSLLIAFGLMVAVALAQVAHARRRR